MSFDYGNPAGGRTDMVQKPKLDGFVKSQIGLLRCPLSGVWTPAAKFQELVASSSNSLEFLTPPVSKPFLLPNPTFYKTIKLQ
jgi:hypothetical protein